MPGVGWGVRSCARRRACVLWGSSLCPGKNPHPWRGSVCWVREMQTESTPCGGPQLWVYWVGHWRNLGAVGTAFLPWGAYVPRTESLLCGKSVVSWGILVSGRACL